MNCQKCGAPQVLSQRTGKYFCSAKCWLGPQHSTWTMPGSKQQSYQPIGREDRLSMHEIEQKGIKASVARQKSAETVNAMIAAGLIKTKDDIALALDFFASKNLEWLLGVK